MRRLLDLLLNGAGEINIFQSRLTQQLQSIEFHLGELGSTVSRLRDQLRKLEAETEAQILHRHQDDVAGDTGFDPLELDRYSTIQQLSRALAESANDVASINELLGGLTNETETLLTQQARVTAELQNGLMQTRMVPFQRHVARLARIVRQAAADTGKAAELVVEGENSEIDRQVLESMLPPFEHLLRNAVAHGIEAPAARKQNGKPEIGRVALKVKREGSEVLIEVADDGGGLDLAAIRRKALEKGLLADGQKITDDQAMELILQPGFSTAGELTQTAGRGVGMDVVDNEVKKLGGSMRIESTAGQGTRFLIRLPYTLAITHALIVNVGEETFALPLPTVEGITRLSREKILKHMTEDEPKLDYGGITYRIQHLGSLVGGAPSALPDEENSVSLVLIRAGESSTALLTDSLEGSREIVVKTLGPHIANVAGVTGATILGDGRVIMILDPGTLVRAHRAPEIVAPVAAAAGGAPAHGARGRRFDHDAARDAALARAPRREGADCARRPRRDHGAAGARGRHHPARHRDAANGRLPVRDARAQRSEAQGRADHHDHVAVRREASREGDRDRRQRLLEQALSGEPADRGDRGSAREAAVSARTPVACGRIAP